MDVNLNLTGVNVTNVTYVFWGNNTNDVNLYRPAANVLGTDDILRLVTTGTSGALQLVDANLRFYRSTNDLIIDTIGNVGINTSTPQALLQVATVSSSSTDAANITNLGTGDSFVVEDSAGDTTPFLIDASGNVGIGTTTPQYPLHVAQGSSTYGFQLSRAGIARILLNSTSEAEQAEIIWANNTGLRWTLGAGVATSIVGPTHHFALRDNAAGANRLIVDSSGNVGIGTTTPTTLLTLWGGNLNISGNNITGINYLMFGNGTDDTNLYRSAANILRTDDDMVIGGTWTNGTSFNATNVYFSDDTRLRRDLAGSLRLSREDSGLAQLRIIGANVSASRGRIEMFRFLASESSYERISIVSQGDSAVYQIASESGGGGLNRPITFLIGSTEVMRIDNNTAGRVGINTTSPQAVLNVISDGSNVGANFTNLGTGNSFVVMDSAGDSSPFIIDSAGNVGIGTTTPDSALDVGTGNITFDSIWDSVALYSDTRRINSADNLGFRIDSDNTQTDRAFYFQKDSGTTLMFLNENGQLGINTTSPTSSLHLLGNLTISDATANIGSARTAIIITDPDNLASGQQQVINFTTAGGTNVVSFGREYENPGTAFVLKTSDGTTLAERMRITGAGNVGINTTTPQALLNVITSDTASSTVTGNFTNLGTGNSFVVMDSAGDTSPFLIDASGNVGIGTTTPTETLSVVGSANISTWLNASALNISGTRNVSINSPTFFLDTTNSRVGIGDTTPSDKLQINDGSARINTGSANVGYYVYQLDDSTLVSSLIRDGSVGDGRINLYDSSGNLRNVIRGQGDSYITGTGRVGINTTTPQALLNVITSDTGSSTVTGNFTNLGSGNSFVVMDAAGDTSPFLIDSSGNVGIGTTTPTYLLDVRGAIHGNTVRSNYTQPSYDSIDDGLLLYLPFSEGNGSSTTYDRSPYGRDGTLNSMNLSGNATSGWVENRTCVLGNCLLFDGIDDDVSASDAGLPSGTRPRSMFGWFRLNAIPGAGGEAHIVNYGTSGTATQFFGIFVDENADFVMSQWGSGVTYTTTIATGRWYFGGVTYDSTNTTRLYLDGVEVASGTVNVNTVLSSVSMGDISGSAGTRELNGYVDEVRIYNKTLSADQIRKLYLDGLNATLKPYIDNAGNVGIGTTTPTETLSVVGSANISTWLNASSLNITGTRNVSIDSPTFFIDVANNRVGIGTASPVATLQVAGTINATGGDTFVGYALHNTDGSATSLHIGQALVGGVAPPYIRAVRSGSDNGQLRFFAGGADPASATPHLVIDDGGNVGIGTTSPTETLSVVGSANFSTWLNASALNISGTRNVSINSPTFFLDTTNSRVGIGTASPSSLLHVNGIGRISGNVILDRSGGTEIDFSSSGSAATFQFRRESDPAVAFQTFSSTGQQSRLEITTGATAEIDIKLANLDMNGNNISSSSGNLNLDDQVYISGNVGIGTTTPRRELDVRSTGAAQINLSTSAAHEVLQIEFTNGTGLRWSLGSDILAIGTAHNFGLYDNLVGSLRFVVDAGGDVGIGAMATAIPGADFNISTTTACSYINAGSTSFTACSSRDIKENITEFKVGNILDRISSVPVNTFNFKNCTEEGCMNKLGLIAEDFYPVLERGDGRTVNGQDVQMTMWLGMQELIKENEELKSENTKLKSSLDSLESRLVALEKASLN